MGKKHTVKQGETLVSIAETYGFRDWRIIYDHAENAELRTLRPDPEVLSVNDTVNIPDKEQKFVACKTNTAHKFRLKSLKAYLNLTLNDDYDEPYARVSYVLTIDEKKEIKGTTDKNGSLKEVIPPGSKKGVLVLSSPSGDETWNIDLGHLEPAGTDMGYQARLTNLGYACGKRDGKISDKTLAAVKSFQADNGLEATGELDDATKSKIDDLSGQ